MKGRVKSSESSSPAVSRTVAKKEEATALFALLEEHEHEQVSLVYEPSTGYRGIIAIHDTTLGPALFDSRLLTRRLSPARLDVSTLLDGPRLGTETIGKPRGSRPRPSRRPAWQVAAPLEERPVDAQEVVAARSITHDVVRRHPVILVVVA